MASQSRPDVPPMSPGLKRGLIAASVLAVVGVLVLATAIVLPFVILGRNLHHLLVPDYQPLSSSRVVKEGESFTIDGLNVADGWRVVRGDGTLRIEGLALSEDPDPAAPVFLQFSFVSGSLGTTMPCTAEKVDDSPIGFDCQEIPAPDEDYDRIEVSTTVD